MSDGFEFDFSSLFKGIDFAESRIRDAAERGMHKVMDDLGAESKREAPRLSGNLRNSQHIEVRATRYSVVGEVSYTVVSKNKRGWGFNYALRLHDYPRQFKDPTTSGTRPKFLSGPLKARKQRYEEMIADEIRKELS